MEEKTKDQQNRIHNIHFIYFHCSYGASNERQRASIKLQKHHHHQHRDNQNMNKNLKEMKGNQFKEKKILLTY